MSDLNLVFIDYINNYLYLGIPVAIIIASFLGSTHCISMCGPLSMILKKNKYSLHLYNSGRRIS
ncbi:MAG: hypothetical protein GTO02_10955, partial [Candidatus Dadabacteria bacterium]|nr:hypothetical protein [Candidatus Dadabacteria bacterium]NIQ14882.1 hypothetical protein [Candidatus Dadabacteria bacterium]